MKQYAEMKQKHPDAILLFRVGDFYETFSEDAIAASQILGITLTKRANGYAATVELAGFPHHALDTYLPKLVRAGRRVAICEQLEDPKTTNKLVKRGIIELVTPGVAMGDNILSHRENNFLAAVHFGRGSVGVALLDISTGEYLATEGTEDYVEKVLSNMAPKEILIERGLRARAESLLTAKNNFFELDEWMFGLEAARERLLRQFGTTSLKGFGLHDLDDAVVAAGAIMHYLDLTQHTRIGHITGISRIAEERYVRLDRFTVRNLELIHSLDPDGRSLLDVLDRTATPMGSRLLHRWLLFPLKDVAEINERLDIVEAFFRAPQVRERLIEALATVGDMERQISKVAADRATPRDLLQIRNALSVIPEIKELCVAVGLPALATLADELNDCADVRDRISHEIAEDANQCKGDYIRAGVDAELDRLRAISTGGKDYLLRLQQRESEATGIPSLKIGYNNVFGYYIEVTNTHRSKVPPQWIRKQTLVNAERYITEELKQYETQILTAQDKIESIQTAIYARLTGAVAEHIADLKRDASLLARLDVLCSFTRAAADYKYVRPIVDDSLELRLTDARHPVIERQLPAGEHYVANTVELENDTTQILMITGPNMSGKSALLRQTALNVIMAQAGCFVAAASARIGVVDKIFTRVGASDNISLGESTFMVEMNEASSILNNMSRRSLILFDELGRGTSTYDGISIAWAIIEYIHSHQNLHPKTLFATHYHELNDMAESFDRIRNANVSVAEADGKIVFLRKLAPGGSEHSFGIHVARLAGMPRAITERADSILAQLERHASASEQPRVSVDTEPGMQLSFFQLDDPVLEQVRDQILKVDIDRLTPLEALTKLADIKSIITGKF